MLHIACRSSALWWMFTGHTEQWFHPITTSCYNVMIRMLSMHWNLPHRCWTYCNGSYITVGLWFTNETSSGFFSGWGDSSTLHSVAQNIQEVFFVCQGSNCSRYREIWDVQKWWRNHCVICNEFAFLLCLSQYPLNWCHNELNKGTSILLHASSGCIQGRLLSHSA